LREYALGDEHATGKPIPDASAVVAQENEQEDARHDGDQPCHGQRALTGRHEPANFTSRNESAVHLHPCSLSLSRQLGDTGAQGTEVAGLRFAAAAAQRVDVLDEMTDDVPRAWHRVVAVTLTWVVEPVPLGYPSRDVIG